MYELSADKKSLNRLSPVDFSSVSLKEQDIEDILVNRIGILDEDDNDSDEENGSLLIVGRQVRNEGNGRSDLAAIDKDGNLVLIEIKRDAKDIKARPEPFAFQAIRYVASYSTIKTVSDLAKQVYVPFLEKHKKDNLKDIPKVEQIILDYAVSKLNEFLSDNNMNGLSGKQRIILVAGSFDKQTLSAADWLRKNKIEISCVQLNLFKMDEKLFLDVKKLIPQKDYILSIAETNGTLKTFEKNESSKSRSILPKISTIIDKGVIFAGDVIEVKNHEEEIVELQSDGQVKVLQTQKENLAIGEAMSMQRWLQKALEWDAVDTYKFARVKQSKNPENNGQLIYDIREKWMLSQESESC